MISKERSGFWWVVESRKLYTGSAGQEAHLIYAGVRKRYRIQGQGSICRWECVGLGSKNWISSVLLATRGRFCLPLTSSSSMVVLLSVDSLTFDPSLFLLTILLPTRWQQAFKIIAHLFFFSLHDRLGTTNYARDRNSPGNRHRRIWDQSWPRLGRFKENRLSQVKISTLAYVSYFGLLAGKSDPVRSDRYVFNPDPSVTQGSSVDT